MTTMSGVLEIATGYVTAGLSVVPIILDGSKKSARPWKAYEARRATDLELAEWFGGDRPSGLAVVCGAVSGNLECLDLDDEAAGEEWLCRMRQHNPDLLAKITLVRTPRPGLHAWYRVDGITVPGNLKLAWDVTQGPGDEKPTRKTLAETRGEGGYALVPGCPAAAHTTGRPYEHVGGPALADVATISADERDVLHLFARLLDRTPEDAVVEAHLSRLDQGRPGDDYQGRGEDWHVLLERHGWKFLSEQDDGVSYWQRPGKGGPGHSATLGKCRSKDGQPRLRVFSSNADPFEDGKAYTKFAAFATLEHQGDYAAASRALRQGGFGGAVKSQAKAATGSAAPAADEKDADEQRPESIDDVARVEDLVRAGSLINWLWPGWIARGVCTGIAAESGVGKTRFTMDLMRGTCHGLPWPDGAAMPCDHRDQKWLWVLADDHHAEAAEIVQGWGMADVFFLPATKADPFGGTQLDGHIERLRDFVRVVRPTYLVIDTLGSATNYKMNAQDECEALMKPLRRIAHEFGVAVLCLTHLNASGGVLGRRVVEKVRQVIKLAQPDPDGQVNRRRLWIYKSNARKPPHLGITMHDRGCDYDEKPPEEPSDEPGGQQRRGRPSDGKLEAAMVWLKTFLGSTTKAVGITRTAAEQEGINAALLYKAKDQLGVEEITLEGRKWWTLTTDMAETDEGQVGL